MRRLALPALCLLTVASARPVVRWGEAGHQIAARAATGVLPAEMPPFFRAAGDQLVYLDPEPDRWRNPSVTEMHNAFANDHFIDLEEVPEEALTAPDRYAYMGLLHDAGVARPELEGFLPFRIVELYQRLVAEWRLWRSTSPDDPVRGWIEQRILNDAGILGHYVTDGSQPHHTTIHYNGWSASAPNPDGYTLDRNFHVRFETDFVSAQVRPSDVGSRVRSAPRSLAGSVRSEVIDYLRASNEQVVPLYRLEKQIGFDPRRPAPAATRDFAAERLAAGARMLADLWWSAWLESARPE